MAWAITGALSLPSAHAVLFILAADTGVTQSDLAVWRNYVQGGGVRQRGRLVVLNKIDGLWDGLRDPAQIDLEIGRQVDSVAETLGVERGVVFPVSAQKGLVARIQDDAALLERSRIPALERALSDDLLPTKQEIVREDTLAETREVSAQTRALLEARLTGLREQLQDDQPCPVCGDTVREVSFADSSLQYCATCQTGGKPLADRRLSRLLK